MGRVGNVGLGLLVLLVLPFSVYAVRFGITGLTDALASKAYLFAGGGPLSDGAIRGHMILGGIVTLLAPLQLVAPLRRRFPAWHRWSGRIVTAAAAVTGLAGLLFIALRGTIGGPPMSAGFIVYGGLIVLCAVQTHRHARARRIGTHRAWAIRLFVLAIASWAYRAMYGAWYLATDGAGSEPDFSGPFDLFMNWGFFLPWLLLAEVLRRRRPYQ